LKEGLDSRSAPIHSGMLHCLDASRMGKWASPDYPGQN